jgi:hypothetical protein
MIKVTYVKHAVLLDVFNAYPKMFVLYVILTEIIILTNKGYVFYVFHAYVMTQIFKSELCHR